MAETIANYVRERQKIEPLNLLDVGCGSGRSLRFLEREDVADQLNFYGLDNSACRLDTIYQPSRWRLTFADVNGEFPTLRSILTSAYANRLSSIWLRLREQ